MTYAIVYSSRTGNTGLLADTIRQALPAEQCLYFGAPAPDATEADCIFAGFWTDKGACDADTASFLRMLRNKKVFLFGTAGFGGSQEYFDKLLHLAERQLDSSNELIGTYMCQGKMPMSVRERYVKMLSAPIHMANLEGMIENFDRALSHPDQDDLDRLRKALPAL